jgi:hypothetical protein
MAGICGNQPAIIALVKITGPSLGIVAAAFAWIANNFISWCAWQIGRSIKRYDTMKALRAEISSNSQSEQNYADPEAAEVLIASLRADIGPFKPLIPYVAVIDRNVVFDNVSVSLSLLPAKAAADVVAYYNLTDGLTAQLMDFRSETFARLATNDKKPSSAGFSFWEHRSPRPRPSRRKRSNLAYGAIRFYLRLPWRSRRSVFSSSSRA